MEQNAKMTPLYNLHKNNKGRFVDFAGYALPIQYDTGIKAEHLHTRKASSLFDVSHMGQLKLTGKNIIKTLEQLLPCDLVELPENKLTYSVFTNKKGGIIDDCIVGKVDDNTFNIVVNASRKVEVLAHLQKYLPQSDTLEIVENYALIALQGPSSETILNQYFDVSNMSFMTFKFFNFSNQQLIINRAGYTGEDGFEIAIPSNIAPTFAEKLLSHEEVNLAGLGARDSLRLEAGLCLYGNDLDMTTTPIEASMSWVVATKRRNNANFLGADIILKQLQNKSAPRKRIGLTFEGRVPVRNGTELFTNSGDKVGVVTSGSYSPILEKPIAMAYLDSKYLNTENIYANVRKNKLTANLVNLPFVQTNYKK